MREGWSYKKLGEVCSSIKDGSHNPPKGCSFSEYIMISSQNIFNEELRLEDVRYLGYDDFIIEDKRTNLRAGDVLLTIVGTIGRCYVFKGNEGNITLQRSVAVLSPKDFIDSRFLMYSLRGKNQVLVDEAHGIAQKGIYLKQLSSLEISYPNVSTQQQIVSELDLLSHILDQKRQQLKEYDALAESIFYDMFGDPVENPKGWEVKKLEEIVSSDCSISYGIVQPGDGVEEGVPVVRPVDLIDTYVYRTGLKQTTKEISDSYKRSILKGGEILMCVRGTTGLASLASQELAGCNVTRGIVPLSFDSDASTLFVFRAFKCKSLLNEIADKTNGIALKQINMKDLRQIELIFPPLSLQRSFAAKIESIEHQKQLLRVSIKETEMLFQSRMDYWFNG